MKKIFIAAFTMFIEGAIVAQNTDSIPDPEFINQIYLFNRADKKLSSLEKTETEVKTKTKLMGMGGTSQLYVIDGSSSGVRLNSDDHLFVISTGGGMMMDPSTMIKLHKFESKKKNREATVAKFGMGGSKDVDDGSVTLNFKKLKEGIYAILPAKKLEKGEYAFINQLSMSGNGMSMKWAAFAFTVD